MSTAALALALALLVAPNTSRHRVLARRQAAQLPSQTSPASAWAKLLPCVAALVIVAVGLAPPGVVVAMAIIGATLEIRRWRRLRLHRRTAEATALQGALDVFVGELRTGAHPVAALDVAAKEVDGVVAASFHVIAARARMGADVATGMRSVARRSSLPGYWERLAACWQLAQSHGLAIATLMQTAQRDILERERFSARVAAGMAGARATAAVLAGLPALGIGLGQLIGANPAGFLLSAGLGEWLLVIGVVLACSGLLWSDRITNRALR